jgi:poly(hydroxyalkanoate) depolymerase family esterase
MSKSLGSLWLKSVKRMGRAQQSQSRKLFKSLLAKSVSATKKAAIVAAKTPLKSITRSAMLASKPRAAAPRKTPQASAVKSVGKSALKLPGKTSRSYFAMPAAGMTPGRRMLYEMYVPSDQALAPLPLVVMLHGCQQTAAEFAAATRLNELAERKGFAVLYPQQSSTADRHRCWHWYKRSTQQGQGDVDLVATMVRQIQVKNGFDTSRTYVAGLSAGAGLAALLALNHPELIAAVGLHSAPVFGTTDSALSAYAAMQQGSSSHSAAANTLLAADPRLALKAGLPVMLIHGERDAVVRRVNLHQLEQQFRIINAAAITQATPVRKSYPGRATGRSPRHAYTTVTYPSGRKPQVVSCEISSLGHAWSGGDSSLPFTAQEGPNASLMFWEFFARHSRGVV